jgi:prepilin-type N-terminal cleavage/methylation domain-containing protein
MLGSRSDAPMRIVSVSPSARQRGFTLIEAVVALAILALTLTIVYQIFGWTLRHSADQRHRDRAWLTAQSLLSQMRADRSLAPGRRAGRTLQGLTWDVVVEPFAAQPAAASAAGRTEVTLPVALVVAIKVHWDERPGAHIELRSVELGEAR